MKHVEIKHFCSATLGTTGTTLTLDKSNDDRAVGRHHDKTHFIPYVGNFGSENWPDKKYHRSLKLEGSSEWISDARKALTSNSMIIYDGMFSAKNLTSFQYFSSELVAWWMLRELASKGVCDRV